MNRRHLLKGMGVVALSGSFTTLLSDFFVSCSSNTKIQRAGFFTDEEFQILERLTDILLPKTSTPGALEVQVPLFLDQVAKDCMSGDDQQLIQKGLQQLNTPTERFLSLSSEEKYSMIKKIDEAAFKNDSDKSWFRIIKKLSLIGYFTSKDGMTKALDYVKVPGDYKACIPYKKGEKGMAKTFLMYW